MKKLYFSALLVLCTLMLNAQVTVTFRVDMTGQTVDATGVHAAGNFQNWTPSDDAWKLLPTDNPNIYSLTASVTPDANGQIEFKYVNGNAWQIGGAEVSEQGITASCGSGGIGTLNRLETIGTTGSYVLPLYLWNSCEISPFAGTGNISTASGLKASPNPFSDKTIISFNNPSSASHDVIITSLTGQVVRNMQNVTGGQVVIERGNLTSGVYFVSIRNDKGEISTQKVVVE